MAEPESEGTPADATVPGRSGWQIALSTVGLLALVGIVAFVWGQRPKETRMEQVLGSELTLGDLPFGLTLLEVETLKDGRRVAVLGLADDVPPLDELGSMPSSGGRGGGPGGGGGDWRRRRFGGGGGMMGSFNPDSPWIRLPAGETGQPPWQVALVRYPASSAEGVLSEQFARIQFQDLSQISERGGVSAIDTGHLLWNGYRLPWVRTRHFRKEDGKAVFHDSIRVNLTRGRQAIVLYARWRPGQKGDSEVLQEVVRAVRLLPTES